MSSLATSSHTESYFLTTVSFQYPLCRLPIFHPDFNLFYFMSDMAPEKLRVRFVSEVNMVRLRGSGQLKPKGFIGLDNPSLMWLNEALRYAAHGLMLHIRLPEHNRGTVPSFSKKKKKKKIPNQPSQNTQKIYHIWWWVARRAQATLL